MRGRAASPAQRARIFNRDGQRCQLCGCAVGQGCNLHYSSVTKLDVAHIVPWADTHDTSDGNLRILCHPCNMREAYHTEGRLVYVK